ncbi:hypothetical protein HYZ99_01580 [Candidatus Peregrinibacteria bacterium]|nr:hypothetical protein [Candidatus Peregrinibacteria bacterium]
MKNFISFFLTSLLLGTPAFAFAVSYENLSADQKRQLYRSCGTAADKPRCEARQLARLKAQAAHNPTGAEALYDKMDLGKARLRNRLQRERATDNKRRIETTRRTYRQLQSTDDHNTRRRDFLNELRLGRLACMTETKPGNARRQCLDRLQNEIRDKMRAPSSADPVLNQGK